MDQLKKCKGTKSQNVPISVIEITIHYKTGYIASLYSSTKIGELCTVTANKAENVSQRFRTTISAFAS